MARDTNYKVLNYVPKNAIVDFLIGDQVDASELSNALTAILKRQVVATESMLYGLSREQLVELATRTTGITDDLLLAIYEEWRYRGMKSLYLHRMEADSRPSHEFERYRERLNQKAEEFQHTADESVDEEWLNREPIELAFDSVEEFRVRNRRVVEVGYRYLHYVDVINPDDEMPTSVPSLRRGFIWLSFGEGWAAISAVDLQMRDAIVTCLELATPCSMSNVRFTKKIVTTLEPRSAVRRMAFVDPSTRISRRYTGKGLGSDTQAVRELETRERTDDAPHTGYDVNVDARTQMVLGYSNNQGKIFFSRDLSVQQLRNWGTAKISRIVEVVREHIEADRSFAAQISSDSLRAIPSHDRPASMTIVAAIANAFRNNEFEYTLTSNVFTLGESLQRWLKPFPYVLDGQGEYVEPICARCQNESVIVSMDSRRLFCTFCGVELRRNQLRDSNGERVAIDRLPDAVMLFPDSAFSTHVFNAVSQVLGRAISHADYGFVILGSQILIRRMTVDVVVRLSEIPEFQNLLEPTVPRAQLQPILNMLPSFKEKCRRMSNANCASCVDQHHGSNCYLRLFGLVDQGFTPTPHQGNEYGDYNSVVTVNGRRGQNFVVLMKSLPQGNGQLTSATNIGREILEQFYRYATTPSMHVVGVCVPRELHPSFREMLIDIARWNNKKLAVLGPNELASLIYTVKRRRRIRLNQF